MSASSISEVVDEIEAEMRRIGYWSNGTPPASDPSSLFSGMSFEQWLQFEYLPKVRYGCLRGDYAIIPPYKVGLAALRQYDYHSHIPEAKHLLALCSKLENLLPLPKSL